MDTTHPLQQIAARAIDRAVGRQILFIPAGDESKKIHVVGSFSPRPVIRMPDGQMIQSEEPTAWISARLLKGLTDEDGEPRDPEGGSVSPDFIRLVLGPGSVPETNRKVLTAELNHDGYWKLKVSNPL